MTKRQEREQRIEKLRGILEKEQQLNQERIQLNEKLNSIIEVRAERNEQLKIVQKEFDFYQELGHSKEKYEKLRELKKLEKDINQTIKNLVSERDRKETEKDELDRTTTNMKRKIDSTNRQIEDNKREINGLENQLQRNEDR